MNFYELLISSREQILRMQIIITYINIKYIFLDLKDIKV